MTAWTRRRVILAGAGLALLPAAAGHCENGGGIQCVPQQQPG